MTKHTIQYEEMVEKSKEVAVCNGCGTEIEEESEIYIPKHQSPEDDREIHLHHQCEGNLLETPEPDSESSYLDRVSNFEVPDTIGAYTASVKYITAFIFLPFTFVRVARFIRIYDERGEKGSELGTVIFLSGVWIVCFIITLLVIL